MFFLIKKKVKWHESDKIPLFLRPYLWNIYIYIYFFFFFFAFFSLKRSSPSYAGNLVQIYIISWPLYLHQHSSFLPEQSYKTWTAANHILHSFTRCSLQTFIFCQYSISSPHSITDVKQSGARLEFGCVTVSLTRCSRCWVLLCGCDLAVPCYVPLQLMWQEH